MKMFRISMILIIGVMCLAGMDIARYGWNLKDSRALLESCLIPVNGESDISGQPIRTPDYNPGIYYEGSLLPYDKGSGRLYLPQAYGQSEWYGKLAAVIDGKEYPIYFLCDEMIEKKEEAVRESHDFVIYVPVNGNEYCKFLLTITGMPLISMVTEYEEEAEEIPYEVDPDKKYFGSETRYYGEFLMMDPGAGSGQYQITEAAVCYHYKGATAATLDKKSYSIDLLDYRGEKAAVSLAGLHAGDTWKLNALYTDESRVREITASQIWELIDKANENINESGPNMEYVELIVDNVYRGVYCLVEPVNAEKMNLKKHDVLYKAIDWKAPDKESIQESIDMKWKIQYPVRIRYPKDIEDYRAAWYPMDNFLDIFYRSDETSYEEALKYIDLDNFCDMAIFVMTVSGSDNSFKNTYYVAECGEESRDYRMKMIPWDLDYTFGNVYRSGTDRAVEFNSDFREIYMEYAMFWLYVKNPEEMAARLNERWNKYRKDFLATDRVIAMLEENRDYLLKTGAYIREKECWPEGGVNPDIEYLKAFQFERMEWLDGYFASWFDY